MKPKLILCLALVLSGGLFGCSTNRNQLSGLPIRYHNTQYYFTFCMPADWKGYSVLTEEWDAPLVESPSDSTDKAIGTERGPIVVLRHTLWRTNDLYQDIEIMAFTHKQWKEEHSGLFFPYAGGVISEMWHNDKYVYGLYSRYNAYDDVKGLKEADDIIAENCAVHPEPTLYPNP